jgi:hypothetical protein
VPNTIQLVYLEELNNNSSSINIFKIIENPENKSYKVEIEVIKTFDKKYLTIKVSPFDKNLVFLRNDAFLDLFNL